MFAQKTPARLRYSKTNISLDVIVAMNPQRQSGEKVQKIKGNHLKQGNSHPSRPGKKQGKKSYRINPFPIIFIPALNPAPFWQPSPQLGAALLRADV